LGLVEVDSSSIRYRQFGGGAALLKARHGPVPGDHRRRTLCAAGKRRQNLNLYGFRQLPFQILLMSGSSIDQDRTRFDHPFETRIGPLLAGNSEGVGN
jgi:hypothetical protein